jgi:hypothetical protein
MKIAEEYADYSIEIIEIKMADYLGNFIIKLLFDDGTEKQVNFRPFLENAVHPSIRKYLDEKLFQDYQIIDGNLNWNDYDMVFPVADLYEGKI